GLIYGITHITDDMAEYMANQNGSSSTRTIWLPVAILIIAILGVGVFIFRSVNSAVNVTPPTFSPDEDFAAFAQQAASGTSQEQQLFADFGIKTVPLATSTDPGHFDPVAALPQVQAFVGAGSELISMQAQYIRPDGTMDLNAQY